jgi:hypothetical protein
MRLAEFTDAEGFVCRIDLRPAYDCFNGCQLGSGECRPDLGGFHGVCGSRWTFSVCRDGDAAQFVLGGPCLPQTYEREEKWGRTHAPLLGWDVGFHTNTRHRDDENDFTWGTAMGTCDIVGGPCWYDGSSLRADEWVTPFLRGEMDVWAKLREEWAEQRAYIAEHYPETKRFAEEGK